MNWDEVQAGDVLVSETGGLVWIVTERSKLTVLCRDLEGNLSTRVERSRHRVADCFTVLRGSEALQEGDPASIHRTYR